MVGGSGDSSGTVPPGPVLWEEIVQATGDWIIRLEIETGVGDPNFAGDIEEGTTGEWSVVAP
jgi:hypothetical protein